MKTKLILAFFILFKMQSTFAQSSKFDMLLGAPMMVDSSSTCDVHSLTRFCGGSISDVACHLGQHDGEILADCYHRPAA